MQSGNEELRRNVQSLLGYISKRPERYKDNLAANFLMRISQYDTDNPQISQITALIDRFKTEGTALELHHSEKVILAELIGVTSSPNKALQQMGEQLSAGGESRRNFTRHVKNIAIGSAVIGTSAGVIATFKTAPSAENAADTRPMSKLDLFGLTSLGSAFGVFAAGLYMLTQHQDELAAKASAVLTPLEGFLQQQAQMLETRYLDQRQR